MVWKMKQLDENVQVQIHQHATQHVDQEFVRSLNYEHYSLLSVDDDSELPLKWYESQPVIGKKLVTMVIQVEDEKSCSVLWGGNTWAFRQALDENGVSGAYFEDDSERRIATNNQIWQDKGQQQTFKMHVPAIIRVLRGLGGGWR